MTDHTDLDAAARDELTRRAHDVIAANKYMTLATVDRDGDPWISPVFFAPDSGRRFLWASSPEALHSRNVAEHPEVSVVVYDSSVPIGGARAVYVRAVAAVVPDDELEVLAVVYSSRLPEQRAFSADDLRDELRLYQAVVAPELGAGHRPRCRLRHRHRPSGRSQPGLASVADGVGAGAAER